MEIVEAGTPEKRWPREWRTPCCQSLLKIAPEDIKHNTDWTGDHTSWFINCPVCGAQPDVPDSFKRDADRWLSQQAES
jgi:hypothetical protein